MKPIERMSADELRRELKTLRAAVSLHRDSFQSSVDDEILYSYLENPEESWFGKSHIHSIIKLSLCMYQGHKCIPFTEERSGCTRCHLTFYHSNPYYGRQGCAILWRLFEVADVLGINQGLIHDAITDLRDWGKSI